MRLRITGGVLEVELEKDAIQKIQDQLQKLGTEDETEQMKRRKDFIEKQRKGGKKSIDGRKFMGELVDKSKIPI